MVDVVRCDRPSGQAGPVPRPQCLVDGCTREAIKRGRCGRHYQRWYDSPDFVRAPTPPPYIPPPDPVCPWCGPCSRGIGLGSGICPTCGLDAAEHAYIDRIIADSSAVYTEEHRAFQAQRRRGGP